MENTAAINSWTKQETLQLIEEYKKYSVLYKNDHPEYLMSNKKKEAYLAIVKALKCIKPNVTVGLVKTKLKTLRQQLTSEKKKILYAKKGEMGAACRPTLWCFDELSFLMHINDEQQASSPSTNVNNMQVSNEILMDGQTQTIEEPEQFIKPQEVRQETEVETFQKTINKSMEIIENISTKKVTSKEEAFCQYLSTELTAFKLEESFDEFKMSAMILLQSVKTKEKKILSQNNSTVWRDYSSPASVTSPHIFPCKYPTSSASSSAYSGSAECSRRRSSSTESALDETMRSSINMNFNACEDKSSVILTNDVKCEPEVIL